MVYDAMPVQVASCIKFIYFPYTHITYDKKRDGKHILMNDLR